MSKIKRRRINYEFTGTVQDLSILHSIICSLTKPFPKRSFSGIKATIKVRGKNKKLDIDDLDKFYDIIKYKP